MAADHEVDIDLKQDANGRHAVPQNIPAILHVGETVHYRSKDGLVTITFDDVDGTGQSSFRSPFLDTQGNEKTTISSSDGPIAVSNRGDFFCHCFITPPTPPGQQPIGWGPNSPLSGGNHVVR